MAAETRLRAVLARDFAEARARADALFDLLSPEALYERPIAERHRLVFYLGHLDTFDWNLVCKGALEQRSRDVAWERLFAFGIDPLGGDLPNDAPRDWPAADAIRKRNATLREDVDRAVAEAPLRGWLEGGWAMRIAIEHRLMHAETLAYSLHRLPAALKRGEASPPRFETPSPRNGWVDVPEGDVTLGLARAEAPFVGWDNEYEQHVVRVPAFRVERHPITNADMLAFVRAGGYRERALWDDGGWAFRERAGLEHPTFWSRHGERWTYRGMFAEHPLPPALPCWLSHAEASAYARWKGAALPTEAQWQRVAAFLGEPAGPHDFAGFDPVPVQDAPSLVGNGWHWTRTPFAPFQGFAPLPFYLGYSADFFDGKHFVLKGASPQTARALVRRSFRNWFQPHYPYVYATARLVEER